MATAEIAPPRPLTAKQVRIYDYLFGFTADHGYQPSLREMMEVFDHTSPNGIHCHYKGLRKKGWIEFGASDSRSIRFLYCPDGRPFRGFEAK
jgi:repressor LexA